MNWRAAAFVCMCLCATSCGQQNAPPASQLEQSASSTAAETDAPKADDLPFPTWSQFKTQEKWDTTGPVERLMIWQVYRDRVVPAIAAHQGLDPSDLQRYFESQVPRPATPGNATRTVPREFGGYPCTQDCSGHEAGYQWAEDNEITDPDDCSGKSQSFIEGCQAYAEEQKSDPDE